MKSLQDYYLQPGYIFVSNEGSMIKTVLGSCVAVCLWDRRLGFGGMNHYIHPRRNNNPSNAQYGDVAMPHLIKIMKQLGSERRDLAAHIVGGASNLLIEGNIGYNNTLVAEEFLERCGITVISRSVGGSTGKKVVFNTVSGELLVYNCMEVREGDWYV